MGHGAATAGLERQAGLGAIERLDLALLVDGDHDCVRGWVHVETDDVLDLGGECRVIGSLEGAYAMGLQAKRVPDPLHGAEADADGFGDHAAGPMRGRLGRLAAWQREHLGDGGGCKWGPTRFARLVSQKAVDAFLGKALLPTPHRGVALAVAAVAREKNKVYINSGAGTVGSAHVGL